MHSAPKKKDKAKLRLDKLSTQELQERIRQKILQDPKMLDKACRVIESWIQNSPVKKKKAA